jgi:hypothetical protein
MCTYYAPRSTWRRFLSPLTSGITWNQMRRPPLSARPMLSAPIPSSLSGSPRSRRQAPQVANPSGLFKNVSDGSRPEAVRQPWVPAVDDQLKTGRRRASTGSAMTRLCRGANPFVRIPHPPPAVHAGPVTVGSRMLTARLDAPVTPSSPSGHAPDLDDPASSTPRKLRLTGYENEGTYRRVPAFPILAPPGGENQ